MASATGIPEVIPTQVELPDEDEDEPLLGRPGDASQQDGRPLYFNLIIGRGTRPAWQWVPTN